VENGQKSPLAAKNTLTKCLIVSNLRDLLARASAKVGKNFLTPHADIINVAETETVAAREVLKPIHGYKEQNYLEMWTSKRPKSRKTPFRVSENPLHGFFSAFHGFFYS